MIKISKNQEEKLTRGRPRLDSWKNLPNRLDNDLKNIDFFQIDQNLKSHSVRLPSPDQFEFRDRFTAAFIRFLGIKRIEPELAALDFKRSWRQFRRYLSGGDQIPKMDVVTALAGASNVPVDWILGTQWMPSDREQGDYIAMNIFELLGSKLTQWSGNVRLPKDFFNKVSICGDTAAIMLIKGSDAEPVFRDGDMVILEMGDQLASSVTRENIYLLNLNGNFYWQNGLTHQDQSVSYRTKPETKKDTESSNIFLNGVVGRAAWLARRLP